MISPEGPQQFAVSHLSVRGGSLRADECRFSRRECRIRLPDVRGEIRYGPFAPLGSDIMGPFRFFPMECRHGVLAIARIPFGDVTFRGCICAILYRGQEYRLATYRGVQICSFSPEHIRLFQGSLTLELEMTSVRAGHALRAPKQGRISHTIRESCNVHLQARLTPKGKTIFDLQSDHGVYEFVPEVGPGQERLR